MGRGGKRKREKTKDERKHESFDKGQKGWNPLVHFCTVHATELEAHSHLSHYPGRASHEHHSSSRQLDVVVRHVSLKGVGRGHLAGEEGGHCEERRHEATFETKR